MALLFSQSCLVVWLPDWLTESRLYMPASGQLFYVGIVLPLFYLHVNLLHHKTIATISELETYTMKMVGFDKDLADLLDLLLRFNNLNARVYLSTCNVLQHSLNTILQGPNCSTLDLIPSTWLCLVWGNTKKSKYFVFSTRVRMGSVGPFSSAVRKTKCGVFAGIKPRKNLAKHIWILPGNSTVTHLGFLILTLEGSVILFLTEIVVFKLMHLLSHN